MKIGRTRKNRPPVCRVHKEINENSVKKTLPKKIRIWYNISQEKEVRAPIGSALLFPM